MQSVRAAGLNAIVELNKEEAGVFVSKSGCQGFCQIGPLVTILPEGIFYTRVTPDDVGDRGDHLKDGGLVQSFLYAKPDTGHTCKRRKRYRSFASSGGSSWESAGRSTLRASRSMLRQAATSPRPRHARRSAPRKPATPFSRGLEGTRRRRVPGGRKWQAARARQEKRNT